MKQIVPIVGISKIINGYDVVISGFDGVISKGDDISSEALKAFENMHHQGIEIILLSNSPLRVKDIVEHLSTVNFDLNC